MANPNPRTDHLTATQWLPGKSGNVNGRPVGSKNLSTRIRELMTDDQFEANVLDPKIGVRQYKGQAIDAVITVAIIKAVNGDDKCREWLSKYGWGTKLELEHTFQEEFALDPQKANDFAIYLKGETKDPS